MALRPAHCAESAERVLENGALNFHHCAIVLKCGDLPTVQKKCPEESKQIVPLSLTTAQNCAEVCTIECALRRAHCAE
jgi:hypothetical protein